MKLSVKFLNKKTYVNYEFDKAMIDDTCIRLCKNDAKPTVIPIFNVSAVIVVTTSDE